jgi:hypothetical protein
MTSHAVCGVIQNVNEFQPIYFRTGKWDLSPFTSHLKRKAYLPNGLPFPARSWTNNRYHKRTKKMKSQKHFRPATRGSLL